MSFFNALYTLGGGRVTQPIQKRSHIEIEIDRPSRCEQLTRWAKWAVSFPVQVAHRFFNTVYMMTAKDISRVVASQEYQGNAINYLPFFMSRSGHVVSSQKAIMAITKQYRHDEEGCFERDKEDSFIPILNDLYPNDAPVSQEDFLFTCSHDQVQAFRDPFLNYLGPKALPRLRPRIDEVTEEVLSAVEDSTTVSAKTLAETHTVSILARLFLNHPGALDDFQKIGRAASRVFEYQFLKKWGTPDTQQSQNYDEDLQVLRDAIECSRGEFVDRLQESNLSPLQIKGELLLVYVAGSETTSSVMQYVLWRLGQDSHLQDRIRNQSQSVVQFVNGCLAEYTPVTFFSRFARKDLVISVENPDGTEWKYPIAKGEALIMAPLLANSSIFGGGIHSCPGQWLARAELCSMVSNLVARYDIQSFPRKQALSTVPGFGVLKVEPVDLTLLKRDLDQK